MALTKKERQLLEETYNGLAKLKLQVLCGATDTGHDFKFIKRESFLYAKVRCSKCGLTTIREMTNKERKLADKLNLQAENYWE